MSDEKPKYTNEQIAGYITSVVRGATNTGRDYATIIVDGREYTAWDQTDIGVAEAAQQGNTYIRAEASNKEGSRYWTIRRLNPTDPPAQSHGQAQASPLSMSAQEIRATALKAATALMVGKDAEDVLNTARQFELYVIGNDIA